MPLSPSPERPLALTVYCASSKRAPRIYLDAAAELGRLIASRGHTLIYGGGNIGLMGVMAAAAMREGGTVKGIILADFLERGYGHSGHEMHSVDDMRLRKRGLDEFGDAYIALPGGFGTFEEIAEMLSFKQLGLHHKPIVFINTNNYFEGLMQQFERGFSEALIHERFRNLYSVVKAPAEALEVIEACDTQIPAEPSALNRAKLSE